VRLERPRLEPLDPEQIDPDLWGRLGPGQTRNIFRTLAHHPALAKRSMVLGTHLLYRSSLPGRLREMAILRVGWLCRSEYEFGQHTLIGRDEGIGDDELRALTGIIDAWPWTEPEQAVLRAADELHDDCFVTDSTWVELTRHLTTEQILDLIFTIGYYHTVCMVLNALGVQREPDTPGFPDAVT
jgi:4-carboxymuconolactone decarboxylase